jgi:hypothetical protein
VSNTIITILKKQIPLNLFNTITGISKLTVCDKTEETISQSLQLAENLRQSILKRAFEGKLI